MEATFREGIIAGPAEVRGKDEERIHLQEEQVKRLYAAILVDPSKRARGREREVGGKL